MRILALLAFAATPAMAHRSHGECTHSSSANLPTDDFHWDTYRVSCFGFVLSNPGGYCPGTDVHAEGAHLLLADGEDCDVGVLVGSPLLA